MNLYVRGAVNHLNHHRLSAGLNILNLINVLLASFLGVMWFKSGGFATDAWINLAFQALWTVAVPGMLCGFIPAIWGTYGDRRNEVRIRKKQGASNAQLFISFVIERLILAFLAALFFIGGVDILSGIGSRVGIAPPPLIPYLDLILLIWLVLCLTISLSAVYLLHKHHDAGKLKSRTKTLAATLRVALFIEMTALNLLGVLAAFTITRPEIDQGALFTLFALLLLVTLACLITYLLYRFKWNPGKLIVKNMLLKEALRFLVMGFASFLPAVAFVFYFHESLPITGVAARIAIGLIFCQLAFVVIIYFLGRQLIRNQADNSELFKMRHAL